MTNLCDKYRDIVKGEIEIINDYEIKLDVHLNELTLTQLDQMIAFIKLGFIEKKEE